MKPIKKPKILKSLFRTIKILNYDTRNNDLRIPGFCDANQRLSDETNLNGNIVVNLYSMNEDTYHTHPNDLLFNNEGMTELWKLGKNFEESAEMERCTIPKDEAKRFVEAGKKPIVHPPIENKED